MNAYCGNVPETIVALRKVGKMTQRDLAAALKITPQFLNDIEHGRRNLSNERILACKATNIRAALVGARCYEYQTAIDYMRAAVSP